MRARTIWFFVLVFLSAGTLLSVTSRNIIAADSDAAVMQADRAFVQAAAKGDAASLGKMVDAEFTWTDSEGKTLTREEVLRAVPKNALGDESGVEVSERTYGQVRAVQASRGKVHILRMWVQRPSGWKLLVYHEVKQLEQPSTSAGSGVKECENPCNAVPFKPANEAEAAIIASWQALETGVTAHDAEAWAPHIAEEFVQISSNSDHPISKAGRIDTLNKQKASGAGSAPAPLVTAKMFDFGDAVIMTCLHQPYSGKPIHVSRLWIKRDGKWIMSISYQTAIQAAPLK
ncbi:MAG TPA: nuclear transport factor 2 family protein [Candidatus Acidoferrum sp.]|nr:nuclear transport factor 2 family protein [Candidatus Acidoferrum sp.]